MAPARVGFCITAHGYGHAARAAAVMEGLAREAEVHPVIVTQVPEWFFRRSLSCPFTHIPLQTDVGLVQASALREDMEASLGQLQEFYPPGQERIDHLAGAFVGCALVVCDIAPAGILAAKANRIPSVLIENFTWDWIYRGYLPQLPALEEVAEYIHDLYQEADYRIQAEPVCEQTPCDLRVDPVARPLRTGRLEVRQQLGLEENTRLVLVTMGGVGNGGISPDKLARQPDLYFIVPGLEQRGALPENVFPLPADSDLYHPDLVGASDAVIGKVGYSTLAEVFHANVPFGYIGRPSFPESAPLIRFIEENMTGLEIEAAEFAGAGWLDSLPQLLAMECAKVKRENGADRCGRYLNTLLQNLKGRPHEPSC